MENNEQIKIVDLIKQIKQNLKKSLDGQAMCAMKWIHSYVHLKHGYVMNCYNVPKRRITKEDLQKYGTQIFMEHPFEIERRQEKLDNIKHPDCADCWTNESKGVITSRLPQPFFNFHRERLGNPSNILQSMPSQLEVYFNNTCDLKCMYCSKEFSSQWESEYKKNDNDFNGIESAPEGLTEVFYKWLEETAVDSILQYYILGGEPLIQNEVYNFLDKLITIIKDRKLKVKPVLIVVTNGNTPQKYLQRWFEKIDEIQDYISVQIDFSIESYGHKAEYIRTNLKWDTFQSNVEQTVKFSKDKDVRIRVSATHSVLSITSFLDLIKWLHNLVTTYNVYIDLIRTNVIKPSQFAPWNLPKHYGTYIDDIVTWISRNAPEWTDYGNFMLSIKDSLGANNDYDNYEFIKFTEKMKHQHSLDFNTVFPELKDFYIKCQQTENK